MNSAQAICDDGHVGNAPFILQRHGNVMVYLHRDCAEAVSVQPLLDAFAQRPAPPAAGKAGRGEVALLSCCGGETVVFRICRRGGQMARFFSRRFFYCYCCQYRPLAEVKVLARLRECAVAVPFPVAAIIKRTAGGLCYEGAVVTKFIASSVNLLEAVVKGESAVDGVALAELSFLAGRQAAQMLEAGVFHSDLHLGNVLAVPGGVVLIDFDKAQIVCGVQRDRLKSRLQQRWARSANKHRAGEDVVRRFQQGLFAEDNR